MAGCADSSRFADPFTDPFGAGKKSLASRPVDQAPTGSIQQDLPSRSAAVTPVESRPLPAPAAAPQNVAATAAPAPVAPSMPGPLPGADPHWTTNGGTPVVMAQGETPVMLANRYGVPADALVKANGYATTAAVHPGAKLIIPVYRANASAVAKAAPAPAQAPAPQQVAGGGGVSGKVTEAKAATKPVAALPMTKAERLAQRQEELKAEREKAAAKDAERKSAQAQAQEELRAKKAAELDAKTKKQTELKAKADADKAAKAQAKNDSMKFAAAQKASAATETAQAPTAPVQVAKAEQKVATTKAANVDTSSTGAINPDVLKPNSATAESPKSASSEGVGNHPEFRWPVRGRIIQGFANGGDGINIAVPEGTQVKAVEEGEVAFAGSELKGYGNMILIRHPNGYVSAYAHNSELEVKRGDKVKRGQTIAKSGQTGNVGSPQLHFELRKGSTPVDPTTYLAGL